MDFSQLTFNLYPLRCHIHTCLFNVDYVLLFSVFVIALFVSAVVLIICEKRPDPRCKISQIKKKHILNPWHFLNSIYFFSSCILTCTDTIIIHCVVGQTENIICFLALKKQQCFV